MTKRVLIHAPHPKMPTGYANQARMIARRMRDAGWEVAFSSTAGAVRYNDEWDGFRIYARSLYTEMSEDLVGFHYEDWQADLVITLCCPWKLHPQIWAKMRTIHLMTIDCDPLNRWDHSLLANSGSTPAAVTRFGERQLKDAGMDPLYLPHFVDTKQWKPARNRVALRRAQGLSHLFVVAMNAANSDTNGRKAFWEALSGFAAFHENHPQSVLLLHTASMPPDGVNLLVMGEQLGINEHLVFSDQYQVASTGATEDAVAAWYSTADVLLAPSRAEGYCIPLAEAQACGTPVITTSWGPGPELCGPGWQVDGQPEWNETHHATWHVPFISSITEKLEQAYAEYELGATGLREAARAFAVENLDADTLFQRHWVPVLEELE